MGLGTSCPKTPVCTPCPPPPVFTYKSAPRETCAPPPINTRPPPRDILDGIWVPINNTNGSTKSVVWTISGSDVTVNVPEEMGLRGKDLMRGKLDRLKMTLTVNSVTSSYVYNDKTLTFTGEKGPVLYKVG